MFEAAELASQRISAAGYLPCSRASMALSDEFLYQAQDLYQAVSTILASCGPQETLQPDAWAWLQLQFTDLHPEKRQVGAAPKSQGLPLTFFSVNEEELFGFGLLSLVVQACRR